MAFLRDLIVKKVSFVRRPANRKPFLLLKGENVMDEKLKKRLSEILKGETDPVKVFASLEEDGFELSDEDKVSLGDVIDLVKGNAGVVQKDPEEEERETQTAEKTPKEEAFERLEKQNKELADKLEGMLKKEKLRAVQKWVRKNCEFIEGDHEELASEILSLEEVSSEVSEAYKKRLTSLNSTLEKASAFNEIGSSRPAPSSLVEEFVSTVQKNLNSTISKSDDKGSVLDSLVNSIESLGPEKYEEYRLERMRKSGDLRI